MNDLAWQKSSYSSASGDNCVEVAPLPGGGRAIRDSKAPDAGLFVLTPAQWQTLRQAMRRVPVNAPRDSRLETPAFFRRCEIHPPPSTTHMPKIQGRIVRLPPTSWLKPRPLTR